ncbi:VOC family protein [Pseudomaricurvus alkylphenolicus]|uniref:VOC family protein n=1 Tax=Pseudomaricurvus alkylphenolicus TaxID=1306991 RepID=UPI00141F8A5B|nr:VOC family protein [Pseudomaricurvus alkylphenolicus]NIB43545.1 VOC family protein [Pseudomaricurvus alkylphenolicus]
MLKNLYKKMIAAAALVLAANSATAIEVDEKASIKDATTSVQGIHHIGLSVQHLDKTLAFYLEATGFELLKREKVSANRSADTLFGGNNLAYERAVIKAPNMMFELIEFEHNQNLPARKMPVQGPGMTHTCFQSPAEDPGFDKFVSAGLEVLSRGSSPVDLGGYGVTYAYGYDPEGNMIEMEQLNDQLLKQSGYDISWRNTGLDMWMSQVALVTHDIERLMSFYQMVMGFQPYRRGEYKDKPKFDEVADVDNMHVKAGWFRMEAGPKVMEFWQYLNPKTPEFTSERTATSLGYSFSLEVSDIQQEYKRLKAEGVAFFSQPVLLDGVWQVYAKDPDNNIFALRQLTQNVAAQP